MYSRRYFVATQHKPEAQKKLTPANFGVDFRRSWPEKIRHQVVDVGPETLGKII
jgi:hypothetical protein